MKLRTWDGKKQELSIAEAIYREVDGADSERGELEDIRKKLYTLLEVVSALTEHLGEPAAEAVLSKVGYRFRPGDRP